MLPALWLTLSMGCLVLGAALMSARRALGQVRAERAHLARRLAEAERVGRLAVWEAHRGSAEVQWSRELHAIFGTTPETFSPTYDGFLSMVHPDDRAEVARTFKDLGSQASGEIEHRIVTRDGQTRHVRENWEIMPDEGEAGLRALGTILDITEWRQREENLRLFRSIIEASHEAVAIVDPEGRFLYVNKAHEELFGRRLSEAREMTYLACSPPDSLAELSAAVARGDTFEGVVPAVRADGRAFTLWLRADSLRDAAGTLRWGFAIMHDHTPAQRAEEALRATVREKQGLLMEVHHRVKNNLQIITSLLRLESGRANDAPLKSVLSDMQARVRSMGALHETLYRSGEFGKVDLQRYLTQLVDQFAQAQSRSSAARVSSEIASALVPVDQAIPCGLLLNELLTNSFKHAFPEGRSGEVRVMLETDQGALRLSVRDDGVGLPADFEARRGLSLGLQLVNDLARQIGGLLEIGSGPGASFSVRFKPKETAS